MDLQQMMNYIQGYTNTVTPNTNVYSNIQQMPTVFPANIWIEYPGYKNIRDFVVKFSNNNFTNVPIKHSDIVSELYYMVSANPNLIDDYYPSLNQVVGKWTGKKISGVGGVITWMQQPTNFFFVIIVPLILLFGYNVWIIISYVIEVKTAKARKLALEEAKASGISTLDEEEIKRRAVEEYLKKLEAEKASQEEKTEE